MADLLEDADAKLARNEIELLGCYDVHPEPYENDPEAPEARRAFLEYLLAPFLARIRELESALRDHHDWHLTQDREGDAWGIDPVDAYSESGLCERTVDALKGCV